MCAWVDCANAGKKPAARTKQVQRATRLKMFNMDEMDREIRSLKRCEKMRCRDEENLTRRTRRSPEVDDHRVILDLHVKTCEWRTCRASGSLPQCIKRRSVTRTLKPVGGRRHNTALVSADRRNRFDSISLVATNVKRSSSRKEHLQDATNAPQLRVAVERNLDDILCTIGAERSRRHCTPAHATA